MILMFIILMIEMKEIERWYGLQWNCIRTNFITIFDKTYQLIQKSLGVEHSAISLYNVGSYLQVNKQLLFQLRLISVIINFENHYLF
jgi:hypothetical protein